MLNVDNWIIRQNAFAPSQQHHQETVFTTGNGYLCTRGALEEGFPGDRRATFIHGVFDAAPLYTSTIVNAPDWLALGVRLDGERLDLSQGTIEKFERQLDLRDGRLTRRIVWTSPHGRRAELIFERFASLADPHALYLRCRVIPEFSGLVEFRPAINGRVDNLGLVHWQWLDQGLLGDRVYLHARTRTSAIQAALAMSVELISGEESGHEFWDVELAPTRVVRAVAVPGQELVLEKRVSIFTSRDHEGSVVAPALEHSQAAPPWRQAEADNAQAWRDEWERSDVEIEGDDEAQLATRFNIFQLLIAAPRRDDRVSIGAKTLSGFGYRGHVFWDTETFMLPLFTYTAPKIARNLLNYRYERLDASRRKAKANGFSGAQFAWESADTGDEVTPTWVPYFVDPTRLIRIWTGDIEIHISADIAYAAFQYWQLTGDDEWFVEKGAELVLDTAKFWASRAEWNAEKRSYEYSDVIGPDEYHEHVDNNYFTNRMAQWNLQKGLQTLDWLTRNAPATAETLVATLDLDDERLERWKDVIARMYLPVQPDGLVEQFEGYFKRRDVNLAELEPRSRSVQEIFGVEGTNETQVLKQPDVLMLFHLLAGECSPQSLETNYAYYTARTDYTFGSSLGPSMGAILACKVGKVEEAYDQFLRGARADLFDVRGNAGDGIHGASAGGIWQAVVLGFAGLQVTPEGWSIHPLLPPKWKRIRFKFFHRGKQQEVEVKA